jgi:hypothetical protein
VIQLISDIERVSEEHGLAAIFLTDNGKKLKTKLLISRLQPEALEKLAESAKSSRQDRHQGSISDAVRHGDAVRAV